MRTTNNLVFASPDAYKNTIQHAKDTTKQIFDSNAKATQTVEQNSREIARATHNASSRFNDSINSSSGSNNNISTTTSTISTTSTA